MRTIRVALTETYRREPLAVVDGLPGDSAELTPAQLRALAAVLVRIADDCEARPLGGKHLRNVRREYEVETAPAGSRQRAGPEGAATPTRP